VSVRGYSLSHICWAIDIERSGLATPDFLDKEASIADRNYLRDEGFQGDVERARHFIFDELPTLGGTEFTEKLIYHLRNFTSNERTLLGLVNEIQEILTKSS